MDPQPSAPPVVAVVVANEPGDWFEEALVALGSQDYPNQSVLVMDAGGDADSARRVASVLPDAYLRRVPTRPGFAAAANDVLQTVQGASFLVFCHDDVAMEPDAIRLLVEEALRSNAGIVAPKVVEWDNPDRLLEVGLVVDKTGACASVVDRGELDQEQHDAVKDVFAVSSTCLLVRSDLFSELGGFDSEMGDHGADVDFCWRAQVAGARVVVAPQAVVRHHDGDRRHPEDPIDKEAAQTRHHLRTMFKSYSFLTLLRVVPQAMVVTLVETIVALFARRWGEARQLMAAWIWNLRQLNRLRPLRKAVRRSRNVPDSEVRRLQVRGSVRLTNYLQRRLHAEERARALVTAGHELVESVWQGPARAAAALLGLVVLAFLIGSRGLFSGRLPAVGQFAPFPRPSTLLTHFVDGWRTTGLGSSSSAPPMFGILGFAGTVLLGGVGLLQKLLVLGAWPIAAVGAWRASRHLGSALARLVGVIAYATVALPYNSLARGQWGGLLAYAAAPWLLGAASPPHRPGPLPGRRRKPTRPPRHPRRSAWAWRWWPPSSRPSPWPCWWPRSAWCSVRWWRANPRRPPPPSSAPSGRCWWRWSCWCRGRSSCSCPAAGRRLPACPACRRCSRGWASCCASRSGPWGPRPSAGPCWWWPPSPSCWAATGASTGPSVSGSRP